MQPERLRLALRLTLLGVWAVLALIFSANAAFLIGNYFFEWQPNKISEEFLGTLLLAGYSIFFGGSAGLLFYALLRRAPWFFRAYWAVWLATGIWLVTATSPAQKDFPEILGILAILACPGAILQLYPSWLELRHAA